MKYVSKVCAYKCSWVCMCVHEHAWVRIAAKYTRSCWERIIRKKVKDFISCSPESPAGAWHSQVPGSHHGRFCRCHSSKRSRTSSLSSPTSSPSTPQMLSTEWPWKDPERAKSHLKSLPFLVPLPFSFPSWQWIPWQVTLTPLYWWQERVEELEATV